MLAGAIRCVSSNDGRRFQPLRYGGAGTGNASLIAATFAVSFASWSSVSAIAQQIDEAALTKCLTANATDELLAATMVGWRWRQN